MNDIEYEETYKVMRDFDKYYWEQCSNIRIVLIPEEKKRLETIETVKWIYMNKKKKGRFEERVRKFIQKTKRVRKWQMVETEIIVSRVMVLKKDENL
jgi:hypothetical protein